MCSPDFHAVQVSVDRWYGRSPAGGRKLFLENLSCGYIDISYAGTAAPNHPGYEYRLLDPDVRTVLRRWLWVPSPTPKSQYAATKPSIGQPIVLALSTTFARPGQELKRHRIVPSCIRCLSFRNRAANCPNGRGAWRRVPAPTTRLPEAG